MLEILAHSGPARLGIWHYTDKKIPTPNFLLNITPLTRRIEHDIYIAPHRTHTSREPLLVHYGTIAGRARIGRFGILPYSGFGFDIPRELAEAGVEETLALAELYPGYGAVVDGGRYPDLREHCARKLSRRALLCIAGGSKLCQRPRLLVEIVTRIREAVKPNTVLYLPGAPPALMPVLAYMGVDLFDSSHAIRAALRGHYLTRHESYPVDRIKELPCSCRVCISGSAERLRNSTNLLVKHNILQLLELVGEIRESLRHRRFIKLLESCATTSPHAMAALRILYREKYTFLEKYTPAIP